MPLLYPDMEDESQWLASNPGSYPDPLVLEVQCFRFSFLVSLLVWLGLGVARWVYDWYRGLVRRIFDDKYVIGKTLVDHPLHVEEKKPPAISPTSLDPLVLAANIQHERLDPANGNGLAVA
jgi:hypothetical protein